MGRAFLSHSSANKKFVEPIAKLLGNDRCIYDARTFEAGMQTISEIFTGLSNTDVFVFFISDAALNSEWVKIELNCYS